MEGVSVVAQTYEKSSDWKVRVRRNMRSAQIGRRQTFRRQASPPPSFHLTLGARTASRKLLHFWAITYPSTMLHDPNYEADPARLANARSTHVRKLGTQRSLFFCNEEYPGCRRTAELSVASCGISTRQRKVTRTFGCRTPVLLTSGGPTPTNEVWASFVPETSEE